MMASSSSSSSVKPSLSSTPPQPALRSSLAVSSALCHLLRSSLGPQAMSKLVVLPDKRIIASCDGATILRSVLTPPANDDQSNPKNVMHPTAAMILDACKAVERHCGDGTTSTCLLIYSLFQSTFDLIDSSPSSSSSFSMYASSACYPASSVALGLRLACNFALEQLEKQFHSDDSFCRFSSFSSSDASHLIQKEMEDAITVALATKVAVHGSVLPKLLAEAAVITSSSLSSALSAVPTFDPSSILLIPAGGSSADDCFLLQGTIISQPPSSSASTLASLSSLSSMRVVVVAEALQRRRTSSKLTALLQTTEQLKKWSHDELKALEEQAHVLQKVGANLVLCSGKVHAVILRKLELFGIVCLQNVSASALSHACKSTGANPVQFIEQLSENDLGIAKRVFTKQIGSKTVTCLESVSTRGVASIVLRGSTPEACDELARYCDDALGTLSALMRSGGYLCPGAGATEVSLSLSLLKHADSLLLESSSRVGSADEEADLRAAVDSIKAFSCALQEIPRVLLENVTHDPNNGIEALIQLHQRGHTSAGVTSQVLKHFNLDSTLNLMSVEGKNCRRSECTVCGPPVYDVLLTKKTILRVATETVCTLLQINQFL